MIASCCKFWNLLGRCKYKTLSCCKFCTYTQPVSSKNLQHDNSPNDLIENQLKTINYIGSNSLKKHDCLLNISSFPYRFCTELPICKSHTLHSWDKRVLKCAHLFVCSVCCMQCCGEMHSALYCPYLVQFLAIFIWKELNYLFLRNENLNNLIYI